MPRIIRQYIATRTFSKETRRKKKREKSGHAWNNPDFYFVSLFIFEDLGQELNAQGSSSIKTSTFNNSCTTSMDEYNLLLPLLADRRRQLAARVIYFLLFVPAPARTLSRRRSKHLETLAGEGRGTGGTSRKKKKTHAFFTKKTTGLQAGRKAQSRYTKNRTDAVSPTTF